MNAPEEVSQQLTERLEAALQDLDGKSAKLSRGTVYGGGGLVGLLIVVIGYFGSSQGTQLASVVDEMQAMRIELTKLGARVDNMREFDRRITVLEEWQTEHGAKDAHEVMGERYNSLLRRIEQLEGQ